MKKGLESFKASVQKDCEQYTNCFSENGCTKERYIYLPEDNPKLIEMGFKTKCVMNTKCSHDYCGKYKWVLERAKHYSEKTGKTVEEIMESWENDRGYWYMNYYQDCNQPLINSESVIEYDSWISALKEKYGEDSKKWKFKCPSCGNEQSIEDFLSHNIEEPENKVYYNCIGRYVSGIGCDWTLGGLFKINKVSVLKDAVVFPVFEIA
jgi:hypothetical protein